MQCYYACKRSLQLRCRSWLSRKPLQFEDMWKLPHQDRVANLATRYEDIWAKEQQKAKPSLVRDSYPLIPVSISCMLDFLKGIFVEAASMLGFGQDA